ncbi:hypothetical protein O3M35_007918 [Rhynocoris fuscipes]|uniref:RBR-type E3 ubiquitin transferase n=1 Tax=Rhynocoris fuscipes TaxID=488301 RepID=A0AAW1DCN4_9HEMI
MGDRENQVDEICVLESIYTDEELFVAKDEEPISGHFVAYHSLPDGFYVTYKNFKENTMTKLPVSHLPPITLKFKLPSDYPSKSMPDFELSCMWLSVKKLNLLCKRLDELWDKNSGSVILYIWTQFLKEESLEYLGIGQCIDLTRKYISELRRFGMRNTVKAAASLNDRLNVSDRADKDEYEKAIGCDNIDSEGCQPDCQQHCQYLATTNNDRRPSETMHYNRNARRSYMRTNQSIRTPIVKDDRIVIQNLTGIFTHQYINAYCEDRSKIEFLRNIYFCEICFQDKLGSKSIQFLPCKHVYCKDCIKEYFQTRINDGVVQSMPCPHDKCSSEASQHQIKDAIGSILFDKYDQLLLNATLNTMDDITYCPRQSCGTPVMRDADEKVAECSSCRFAFCVFCKMAYHGVEPCRLKDEEKRKIVEEYEQGDEETKFKLEKRYGKKQLQNMIQIYKSEDWISSNSKPCPHCEANIEKSDGCNKMICWKCKEYFCWLCLSSLDPQAPYQHYMDPTSKCNNQLFQGVNMDDEQQQEPHLRLLDINDDFLEIYDEGDDEEYIFGQELDDDGDDDIEFDDEGDHHQDDEARRQRGREHRYNNQQFIPRYINIY